MEKHIIVTGYVTETPGPDFIPELEDWFERLVAAIGMDILIPPVCKWCDVEDNEGLTGIVVITTSHSSIHFWDGYYKFDLYSCRDFDKAIVIDMLKELNTFRGHYSVINREDDSNPVVESGIFYSDP